MQSIGDFTRIGIREAMRTFGLTARAIRFYEGRGLIRVSRDRLSHRYYDAEARRRLA